MRHLAELNHAAVAEPGPYPPEPLAHEYAVVVIKRHYVRDGPEGDEVKLPCHSRHLDPFFLKPILIAQARPDGCHHIKGHADAGKVLRGEAVALAVRVDYGVSLRELA